MSPHPYTQKTDLRRMTKDRDYWQEQAKSLRARVEKAEAEVERLKANFATVSADHATLERLLEKEQKEREADSLANLRANDALEAEIERLRAALRDARQFAEDVREWAKDEHAFEWEDGDESVRDRAAWVALQASAALAGEGES